MCGINGLLSSTVNADEKTKVVKKMNARLAHRGPDNEGIWLHENVCLGHRRLSIIDLSEESNQPFLSPDQQYVVVYNGELYNYRELKLELQRQAQGSQTPPHIFHTNSDTEVVLAAYMRWGKECLQRFNGMFAFAIYDKNTQSLFLARDRMGVKPLYYHYTEEGFIFSSEIRAILHCGFKHFQLNREVVAEYAMYQTVFAPNTIVKGIKMLMPGHYIEIVNQKASIVQYHRFQGNPDLSNELSYRETCEKVNELLCLSVQGRLLADVPFGAFLSGGIDSSAVVGLMSKVSTETIQTFHVSFDEREFSEAVYAKQIAKKFNTKHHDIKLSPRDFLNQLPEALNAIDHPSGDGPNTYIVSKATKQAGISMALSGIGGDELFAGYDVFKRMHQLQQKAWVNAVPVIARKLGGKIIRLKNNSVSGRKIEELLAQEKINFHTAYPLNRSLFTHAELLTLFPEANPFTNIKKLVNNIPLHNNLLLSSVSLAESQTYLQNTLLRDTDQMSMAVALEVREPFLDYRLIEFVLNVRDSQKFPHTPKKLLVDALGDVLPDNIVKRPKMGFTLPWQNWMKEDLKLFCELNINNLAKKNIFLAVSLHEIWQRFLNNDPTITWSRLWHLIVLNKWLDDNKIEY